MPVLDTNFLIAVQHGDPAARNLLEAMYADTLLVPSVVAVEFLTPLGRGAVEAFDELARAFTVVHTDDAWVKRAAEMRARLRRAGKTIRVADFWIAVWADLHGTEVVTRDGKEFAALGVATRTW